MDTILVLCFLYHSVLAVNQNKRVNFIRRELSAPYAFNKRHCEVKHQENIIALKVSYLICKKSFNYTYCKAESNLGPLT